MAGRSLTLFAHTSHTAPQSGHSLQAMVLCDADGPFSHAMSRGPALLAYSVFLFDIEELVLPVVSS